MTALSQQILALADHSPPPRNCKRPSAVQSAAWPRNTDAAHGGFGLWGRPHGFLEQLAAQRFLLLQSSLTRRTAQGTPMPGFRAHELAASRSLSRLVRLGSPGLAEPTKEDADPAVALDKGARPKAEGPKVHIGFRLAADVVESLKASGPGYNVRVEQALRAAGFGAATKRGDAK